MVSVMVSTCRKEAQNKRKQFPLDRRSLSTIRNKVFPKKVFPLISMMPLANVSQIFVFTARNIKQMKKTVFH